MEFLSSTSRGKVALLGAQRGLDPVLTACPLPAASPARVKMCTSAQAVRQSPFSIGRRMVWQSQFELSASVKMQLRKHQMAGGLERAFAGNSHSQAEMDGIERELVRILASAAGNALIGCSPLMHSQYRLDEHIAKISARSQFALTRVRCCQLDALPLACEAGARFPGRGARGKFERV